MQLTILATHLRFLATRLHYLTNEPTDIEILLLLEARVESVWVIEIREIRGAVWE